MRWVAAAMLAWAVMAGAPATAFAVSATTVAQAPAPDDTPEARFNRRFPQKARVGDLINLPILDDGDRTIGHVQKVVRTPDGRIKLVVSYSKWFGWFGRPVAVPIELVVILGRQIASVDMQPEEYETAPTWVDGKDQILSGNDSIRIALGRR